MQDIRQTELWGRYLQYQGWKVEMIGGGLGKIQVLVRKLEPLPLALMKTQRFAEGIDLEELDKVRRANRVVYSILEPMEATDRLKKQMAQYGYRQSSSPYLPSKTLIIDLDQPLEVLKGNLSSNARRILGQKKTGVVIRKAELESFYKEWQRWAKTWIMKKEQLVWLVNNGGNQVNMWVSCQNNQMLSGLLTIESRDCLNYFQTWTNDKGRKLGAHYHLVWDSIVKAKEKGLKYYDFEGIYDDRFPIKKWLGFSSFKRRFGGYEKMLPGCYVRWGF